MVGKREIPVLCKAFGLVYTMGLYWYNYIALGCEKSRPLRAVVISAYLPGPSVGGRFTVLMEALSCWFRCLIKALQWHRSINAAF